MFGFVFKTPFMKKTTILLLLLTAALSALAQSKVLEGLKINSKILGKEVRYSLYLPPDYATSERSYPVVYLLHGYTDDDTGWLQYGEINRLADGAIASGTIPPMVIAMPDGGVSWYVNSADGKVRYEDFLVQEFMPLIEKMYRIKASKRFRGIAGLSMGGYGSMLMALHHPDLFAATAPLSAAIFSDDDALRSPDDRYDSVFGILYGTVGKKGKDRLSEHWYKNSVLKLIEQAKPDDLKKVRYWFDCGDDDFLSGGNALTHVALKTKGIPHEFRMRDGAHTWTYWRTGIVEALQFIGWSFRQQ
jgi:S-formylglutathione hydrolase FrmB